MSNSVMKVVGLDGEIELMNDRVIITRSGILNSIKYGSNSKREIPIGMISEVAFTAPSFFAMGQIEFIRSGSSNTNNQKKVNMNAVKFGKKVSMEFETLKDKIFELINKQNKS